MAAVALAALRAERQRVHDEITNLYWTFTRTARGKPPCVVRPDLYTRRAELDAAIKETEMPTDIPNDKEARTVAGKARVRATLDHIQQAQVELGRAISDLSAVIGYVPECDRLSKLYDKLKAEWYRVEGKMISGPTKRFREINLIDRHVTADQAKAIDEDPHNIGCGYHGWKGEFFSPALPNRELAKRQGFG